jgi:CDP-paratose 2-epimerase
VAHFLYSAMNDRPITIYGDGRQVRDVLAVEDLMRAFEGVRANLNKTAGQIYNVGGGMANTTSLLELIDQIQVLTGHRVRYSMEAVRPGDQPVYVTDYSKLRHHTGWEPAMSVNDILRNIHEWRRQNADFFQVPSLATPFSLPQFAGVPEAAS